MRILLSVIILFVVFIGCTHIKYKDDLGFYNSAQANSFEFMVRVNGSLCKDVDGKIGFCAKQIGSKENLTFHQDAMPYAYQLKIDCSGDIYYLERSIDKNKAVDIVIPKENFNKYRAFSCKGFVQPDDRPEEICAKWRAEIIVYDDEKYLPREEIYTFKKKKKKYLVLGKYAFHSNVNGKSYKKKTAVKIKSDKVKGWSESYLMRYNYYGY